MPYTEGIENVYLQAPLLDYSGKQIFTLNTFLE